MKGCSSSLFFFGECGRFLVLALWVFLTFCRIGEAANPGPALGTFNPTGLAGKAHLVASLPEGVYGFSESHITRVGAIQFRHELKFQDPRIRFCHGDWAPLLSNAPGVVGGKAVGVGMLSHFACRSLPQDWDNGTWSSGRVFVGAALVQQQWIKVGSFYGFARDAKTVATKQASDSLLSNLVDRIVFQSKGPRMIVGDWNQDIFALEQDRIMAQNGFVEIQAYANQAWGRPIVPTCKDRNVRDYVWISKELIPHLRDVVCDSSFFPDHAVLYGVFDSWGSAEPIPIWKKPAPLPWSSIDPLQVSQHASDTVPADDSIQQIMSDFESCFSDALVAKSLPTLQVTQRGRSTTRDVTIVSQVVAPIKKGRKDDLNPTYFGENFNHTRWCRQARRLQSLVRLLQSSHQSFEHREHAISLWKAIRCASGFRFGFEAFWSTRSIHILGAPEHLPSDVPTLSEAELVHQNFLAEFRKLEKILNQSRVSKAALVRKGNPNLIFRDVALPRALPVQTLLCKAASIVTEVSPCRKYVKLDPPIEIGLPIFSPQGLVSITADSSPEQLAFEVEHPICIGDVLTQDRMTSSTQEVFQAFRDLWSPRWNKHCQTEDSRWDPFANFVRSHVPRPDHDFQFEKISFEVWMHAVRSKKSSCATGPDGISREDLLKMPKPYVLRLLALIHQSEQTGLWDPSILTGLIVALEKHDKAKGPQDYRPICVFSLIYRCWSSIRARQFLKWLVQWVHPSLLGHMPGRSTTDLWYHLAMRIESSLYSNEELSGSVADVVKAFNCIPRTPVFFLAKWFRLPAQLVVAWHSAIHNMERRFVVDGAAGPCIRGVTGFPEGDPLSVVSMVLLNSALHHYMDWHSPSSDLLTYVDNYELVGNDPKQCLDALEHLRNFVRLVDLDLDEDKLYSWSTSKAGRQEIRAQGGKVLLSCRDLGGHINYSKKNSMYTIKNRMIELTDFWTWLRRSQAPLSQKLRALCGVAWPRCLHGIPGASIGIAHFARLRASAMAALNFDNVGASSLIQFSLLCSPRFDPGYYACWSTLRTFRRIAEPELAYPLVNMLAFEGRIKWMQGPAGACLNRLHEISWVWLGDGFIQDHFGLHWHFFRIPIQALHSRAQMAWCRRVGEQIDARDSFQGLRDVDAVFTTAKLHALPPDELGMMRTALNGSFFTNDKLVKTGKSPCSVCNWCDAEDSLMHRYWQCPFFQESRSKIPQVILQEVPNWPPCLAERGWFSQVDGLVQLQQWLMALPDTTSEFFVSEFDADGPIHIFTDGSCVESQCPSLRLGSWGIVAAILENHDFIPLAAGVTPGLWQTTLRAEITAVISAVRFSLLVRRQIWVWTDNECVYNKVRAYLAGEPPPVSTDSDHDLWGRLHSLILSASREELLQRCIKVRSHQCEEVYPEAVERWAICGNDSADRLAAEARQAIPDRVVNAWTMVQNNIERNIVLRKFIHEHFLQVARKAILHKVRQQDDQNSETVACPAVDIDPQQVALFLSPGFEVDPLSQFAEWDSLLEFWLTDFAGGTDSTWMWLSPYQLFLDFQFTCNHPGFVYLYDRKSWIQADEWLQHNNYDFVRLAAWFSSFLRYFAKRYSLQCKQHLRRPFGTVFKCWTRSLLLKGSATRLYRWDEALRNLGLTTILQVKTSLAIIQHWPVSPGSP